MAQGKVFRRSILDPVYLDIHIHTSDNPNELNKNYDIDCLLRRIEEYNKGSDFLISLTDHNTINKKAYLELFEKTQNIILGTELHIRNYKDKPPYHCHILFKTLIENSVIDEINEILDELYPDKIISKDSDFNVNIQEIIRSFDLYEFMLLPHGGQNHSQFHKSISTDSGVRYDSILERTIYYNQFEGFTARNQNGLETTQEYFQKLGINGFTNLITCTDNYNPATYPSAKDSKASEHIPTWMLAQPTFDGLRLSLSESTRLIYSKEKPEKWSEYIQEVQLKNDFVDIEVGFTPGLNVIIGGSSSGKTLLVDSIHKKLNNDFSDSIYTKFGIEDIQIRNPSGLVPHYIDQNYILELINDNTEKNIDDIPIIKKVFPGDEDNIAEIRDGLSKFKQDLDNLVDAIENIEELENDLKQIPILSRLVTLEKIKNNIFAIFIPTRKIEQSIEYKKAIKEKHFQYIDEIEEFINDNAFIDDDENILNQIREKLLFAHKISNFENKVKKIINQYKDEYDQSLTLNSQRVQSKQNDYNRLIEKCTEFCDSLNTFYKMINKISTYDLCSKTQEVESMGHKLFIENNFSLSKDKFLEVLNIYLKAENRIDKFENIQPEKLFVDKFRKQNPKVRNYSEFKEKIYSDFQKMNKRKYSIITSKGVNFDDLSAGWRTSVILDLLLGYEGDYAPLIIDQPEDNLATDYINKGLIDAIMGIKDKKQIMLVSHNATIPMLGDAQNIIICKNEEDSIIIRSSCLEGEIFNKTVVDHIAEITDGGKPSIKKRVKKYNLKSYRG